jgi:hypothetical protein
MLVHLGQTEPAGCAQNALLKPSEDGIHAYGIYSEGVSRKKVGTWEFAAAIAERPEQEPSEWKPARCQMVPRRDLPAFGLGRSNVPSHGPQTRFIQGAGYGDGGVHVQIASSRLRHRVPCRLSHSSARLV